MRPQAFDLSACLAILSSSTLPHFFAVRAAAFLSNRESLTNASTMSAPAAPSPTPVHRAALYPRSSSAPPRFVFVSAVAAAPRPMLMLTPVMVVTSEPATPWRCAGRALEHSKAEAAKEMSGPCVAPQSASDEAICALFTHERNKHGTREEMTPVDVVVRRESAQHAPERKGDETGSEENRDADTRDEVRQAQRYEYAYRHQRN